MAAAPVSAAEGGPAGGSRRGPGPPTRAGALLRRLGPHPTDRSPRQGSAGPLLPDIRGGDLKNIAHIVLLGLTYPCDKNTATTIL